MTKPGHNPRYDSGVDRLVAGYRSATDASTPPSAQADTMPELKPLMLRSLFYDEAVRQMKATGCAIRRNHWCAPIVAMRGGKPTLDDEGELQPWKPTAADRKARDWEMVDDPDAEPDTSDIPEAGPEFFERATRREPGA